MKPPFFFSLETLGRSLLCNKTIILKSENAGWGVCHVNVSRIKKNSVSKTFTAHNNCKKYKQDENRVKQIKCDL